MRNVNHESVVTMLANDGTGNIYVRCQAIRYKIVASLKVLIKINKLVNFLVARLQWWHPRRFGQRVRVDLLCSRTKCVLP